MGIRIVRLGSPRAAGEGLRLGTVRRPPRGVRKAAWAERDFFDAWLPELAPSEPLRAWARAHPMTPERWATYQRRYRAEMKHPQARRLLTLLAALSHQTALSVGCYCADEQRCHRTLLRELLMQHGAQVDQPD
jgi:uncharacterized protein YeaO (DUF488 family)